MTRALANTTLQAVAVYAFQIDSAGGSVENLVGKVDASTYEFRFYGDAVICHSAIPSFGATLAIQEKEIRSWPNSAFCPMHGEANTGIVKRAGN